MASTAGVCEFIRSIRNWPHLDNAGCSKYLVLVREKLWFPLTLLRRGIQFPVPSSTLCPFCISALFLLGYMRMADYLKRGWTDLWGHVLQWDGNHIECCRFMVIVRFHWTIMYRYAAVLLIVTSLGHECRTFILPGTSADVTKTIVLSFFWAFQFVHISIRG